MQQSPVKRRPSHNFFVKLMTPEGKVFSGGVTAAEFTWPSGVLQLEPGNISYFGAVNSGELSLRIGRRCSFFTVVHAAASFEKRRLTIVAETIQPIAEPVCNSSNPSCACAVLTPEGASLHPPIIDSANTSPRAKRQRGART